MHLVFQDDISRDKRLDMIRFVFPCGTTAVRGDSGIFLAMFGNSSDSEGVLEYESDYCDMMGRSLFLSKLKVEMNKHSKQYERNSEEVTDEFLVKVKVEQEIVLEKNIPKYLTSVVQNDQGPSTYLAN